jgi:hypothetical protein
MDDKRLERIEDKIDKLSDKLADTNVILGKQHVSLSEHIRRTNLLEKQMAPIATHVNYVQGALKLLLASSAIVGAIELAIKLMK